MNIAFYTLGCKVNQFETQALGVILSEKGHNVVSDFAKADIIAVNTCTVTATSSQKSRRAIRHLAKTYPSAKIAVCGCLSQMAPDSIREIPGVELISGTADKKTFADLIDKLCEENTSSPEIDNPLSRREFELLPAGGLCGHTRALLKIEDGCSNFCTYCIIPYTRGPVRSMPIDKAISECKRLSELGYKEIVITGIEISSYGKDLIPSLSLSDLVATLCREFPHIRFRLGSIEPRTITEDFCVKLKSFTNLSPQFHLSLQSGCDATLSRMRRKYDTARFYDSVTLLREHFDSPAITTDLIVGFPGEDEAEFAATLDFIKKCRFSSMHIFPYSIRKGTPASKMENQVSKAEKTHRVKEASAIAEELKASYLTSRIGKKESVLFEEISDGLWTGYARNYTRIYLESKRDLKNTVLDVKITSLHKDGLLANAD